MKRAPNLWGLWTLYAHVETGPREQIGDRWVPTRPLGLFSPWNRIKLAWGVFTGRYDAVKWPK